ncbi:3-oxoacyl-[acyl-carrier-protein] synthase, partial [Tulasnella sp. 427]
LRGQIRTLTHLETAIWKGHPSRLSPHALQAATSILVSLVGDKEQVPLLPAIKTLTWFTGGFYPHPSLIPFLSPSLQTLAFNCVGSLRHSSLHGQRSVESGVSTLYHLSSMLPQLPKLRRLTFTWGPGTSDKTLETALASAIAKQGKLEVFSSMIELSEETIKALVSSEAPLQALNCRLTSASEFTFQSFGTTVSKAFCQLQDLIVIQSDAQIDFHSIIPLLECSLMRRFSLRVAVLLALEPRSIESIATSWPMIKELRLRSLSPHNSNHFHPLPILSYVADYMGSTLQTLGLDLCLIDSMQLPAPGGNLFERLQELSDFGLLTVPPLLTLQCSLPPSLSSSTTAAFNLYYQQSGSLSVMGSTGNGAALGMVMVMTDNALYAAATMSKLTLTTCSPSAHGLVRPIIPAKRRNVPSKFTVLNPVPKPNWQRRPALYIPDNRRQDPQPAPLQVARAVSTKTEAGGSLCTQPCFPAKRSTLGYVGALLRLHSSPFLASRSSRTATPRHPPSLRLFLLSPTGAIPPPAGHSPVGDSETLPLINLPDTLIEPKATFKEEEIQRFCAVTGAVLLAVKVTTTMLRPHEVQALMDFAIVTNWQTESEYCYKDEATYLEILVAAAVFPRVISFKIKDAVNPPPRSKFLPPSRPTTDELYSKISGDYNPIHINPTFPKRISPWQHQSWNKGKKRSASRPSINARLMGIAEPTSSAVWEAADEHLLAVHGFSIVDIVKSNPKVKTSRFGGMNEQAIRSRYVAMTHDTMRKDGAAKTLPLLRQHRPLRYNSPLLFLSSLKLLFASLKRLRSRSKMRCWGLIPPGYVFAAVGEYSALASIADAVPIALLVKEYVCADELALLQTLTDDVNFLKKQKIDIGKVKEMLTDIVDECRKAFAEKQKTEARSSSNVIFCVLPCTSHPAHINPGTSIQLSSRQIGSNLVPEPVQVSHECAQRTHDLTSSPELDKVQGLEIGGMGSPHQHRQLTYIITQDLLYTHFNFERLIEIGPSPTLTPMATRTLNAKYEAQVA